MSDEPLKDSLGKELPVDAMIIRHTEVPEFRQCRRKWWLASHNGRALVPAVKSAKLRFGSLWHRGLEEYYQNNHITGFPEEAALIRGILLGADEEEARIRESIGAGVHDPEIRAELDREVILAKALAASYHAWAEVRDFGLAVVATEHRILLPLRNLSSGRAWLAFKVDALVTPALARNRLYLLEHKSVSKSTRVDDESHLPLDLQMSLQMYGLSSYIGRLRKQQGRRKVPGRFADTLRSFEGQLVGAYYNLARKQMPGPRVTAPLFARHEVTRTPRAMLVLYRELNSDIAEMRRVQRNPQKWALPSPNPWGGYCTWGCAYREICEAMSSGRDYEMLIEANFVRRDKDIYQLMREEMDDE